MAGFFGLFGKNTKYVDEVSNDSNSDKQDAFFLDPDEAISLGNVEYMRNPKKIRRTFPKTRNGKGGELIQEVSATDKMKLEGDRTETPTPKMTSEPSPKVTERRRTDSSMDDFLKMARDIKK